MRGILLGALVGLVLWLVAAVIVVGVSHAKPIVKTPSSAPCTWRLNGHIIDGKLCSCERVTHADGSSSIHCEWEEVAELRRPVVKVKPKKPAVKPRFGISTGALSHA